MITNWSPNNGKHISVCSANQDHVIVATGHDLFYVEIANGALNQIGFAISQNIFCICVNNAFFVYSLCRATTLDHQIACLDISNFGEDSTKLCAVGLWTDISARIFRLPEFTELHREPLDGG